MKKNIIKIVLFFSVLTLILFLFRSVFRFKYEDGIYDLDAFYRLEKESVDVLVLGTSHAFMDINTAVLYEEYGIAAFDLGGSIQPFWNTYYYLKEALKTQNPKVVAIEAYAATQTDLYSDESRIIKNNFGLKFSEDKLDSLKLSTPDYLPEWIFYHNRYEEINRSDFGKYLGNEKKYENWKGYWCLYTNKAYEKPTVGEIRKDVCMLEKQEEYYRKTIELLQSNGIPVVIFVSPYAEYHTAHAELLDHARRIAVEYGVPFVNYNDNYDELGLDFAVDCADPGHLNYLGSQKLTSALGRYLADNYDLPDRRQNQDYDSWEKESEYFYRSVDNIYLKQIVDLNSYLEVVGKADSDYLMVISISGELPEGVQTMIGLGTPNERELTGGGTWVIRNGNILFDSEGKRDFLYNMELENSDLAIKDEAGNIEVVIDKELIYSLEPGIKICIWDYKTEELADNVWFNPAKEWRAER